MDLSSAEPEIYIHTGMGRTGTSFLQHQVFPELRDIFYRRRIKFRRAASVIRKGKHSRYLFSGEMEYKKLERHMKEFSSGFPHARPIIILRRHDEWIASQHRRFVKSGYALRFGEFFSISEEKAFWEKNWLRYMRNIEVLEKYFTHKPFVLFYDDLRQDPEAFILSLANYMGASIDLARVSLSPRHVSYSEKQLRVIYRLGKRIRLVNKKVSRVKFINKINNLFRNLIRYPALYLAPLVPSQWLGKEQFLATEDELKAVRAYFSEDWEACRKYAERNNPVQSDKVMPEKP